MATPLPPSQPPPPPPQPPYSIGSIEGAVVAFLGSFVGAITLIGATLTGSLEVGAISALAYLGYHAYQNS